MKGLVSRGLFWCFGEGLEGNYSPGAGKGAALAGKDLLGARGAGTHSLQCLQDVVWLCGPFLSLGPI